MQKIIAFTMSISLPEGGDPIDSYPAYKAASIQALTGASLVTRNFALAVRPAGGWNATIVSDIVVDKALDWIEHFEAFRTAVATAFNVGDAAVSIFSAEESDIPE